MKLGEPQRVSSSNTFEAESIEFNSLSEKVKELFSPLPQTKEFDAKVALLIEDFLSEINVSSNIDFDGLLKKFNHTRLPVEIGHFDNYLDSLADHVVTHSVHTSSPRFLGHMTSALPWFVLPLAKLMTAMNQNAVKIETSKAISPYERQALAMMHRLIYNFSDHFYDQHVQRSQSTLGILTSGGTTANITALWCARNVSLGPQDSFSGIENAGLAAALEFYGYEGAVVIGSDLMHYSFDKAADLLGIGARGLIRIPTDKSNRVNLHHLTQAIADCRVQNRHIIAIVGIAGTTDSGAVDPLLDIAKIAQDAQIHFHVDAAWGGPLLFSKHHRHQLAGIEQADSVTIDGHKQLYLPLGIGMLFLRNPTMARAIEKSASYTMRKGSFDLGKCALEGSRSAMALFLQAGLNLLGLRGYEFLIDEGIRKTRYMATRISTMPEFELLATPDINLLIYRYIPEPWREYSVKNQLTETDQQHISEFNKILQKKQRQLGLTFVSRTAQKISCLGKKIPIVALRAVIANPLTTEADIDAVLHDQIQIASALSRSVSPESDEYVA